MSLTRLWPFTILVVIALVTGCASGPPTAPNGGVLSNSDYGEPPNNVDELIASFLKNKLKDPYSAQVERLGGPSRVYQKASLLGPSAYGWGICFRVNAKNSFGGYVGFRTYAVIFRDGDVVASHGEMVDNMFDKAMAEGLCKNIH